MKNFIMLIASLTFYFVSSEASDSAYFYGSNYRQVENPDKAQFMIRTEKRGSKITQLKSFYRDVKIWKQNKKRKIIDKKDGYQLVKIRKSLFGSERIQRYYILNEEGLYEFRELVKDRLVREGIAKRLVPMHLHGEVKEYYPGGQVKSISVYQDNQLQSNRNWLEDGSDYIDNIYYSVDISPEYTLGNLYFRDHIIAGLKESGYDLMQVNEKIVLGWVIMENGTLAGVRKVSDDRLVKLPNILIKLVETLPGEWAPAELDGQKVRYFMTIPFNFRNEIESFNSVQMTGGMLFWD
jgi:hypothetical protein